MGWLHIQGWEGAVSCGATWWLPSSECTPPRLYDPLSYPSIMCQVSTYPNL